MARCRRGNLGIFEAQSRKWARVWAARYLAERIPSLEMAGCFLLEDPPSRPSGLDPLLWGSMVIVRNKEGKPEEIMLKASMELGDYFNFLRDDFKSAISGVAFR